MAAPKVNKKNPEHLLNFIAGEMAIIASSKLSRESKVAIIRGWLWGVTERFGKYRGCPYWSKKARERLDSSPASKIGSWARHEHVVPRNVLATMIVDSTTPSPDAIIEVLKRYALGCVLTADESRELDKKIRQRMPPEFDDRQSPFFNDPWARYRKADIAWTEDPSH